MVWFARTSVLFLLVVSESFEVQPPLVTLHHGGQLMGRRLVTQNNNVDQFFGVRYAKAPVNELRFKKPQPVEPWTGVVSAVKAGNPCTQFHMLNMTSVFGDEDCLFLDIIVPGGVGSNQKKAVMVYIHGGGFRFGNGASYMGTPLALHGDVVYVDINYRVDVFGFLADGPGTGNFGLWDQRAAIQWVKENIAGFGGDSESITIFGESAGGASVVAQMLGKHNDGLFNRAIAQSGSLYTIWAWWQTDNMRQDVISQFSKHFSCGSRNIYECLREVPAQELLQRGPQSVVLPFWHPVKDDDFFPTNIEDESYELSHRFDVLAGYNGQEGILLISFEIQYLLQSMNQSLDDGCSLGFVTQYLTSKCLLLITDQSPELCVDFVIRHYQLDEGDDKNRCINLASFLGELYFNVDITNFLLKHSAGNTSTYGYHFLEYMKHPGFEVPWRLSSWAKHSADHFDEIPFVFGLGGLTEEILEPVIDVLDPAFKELIIKFVELPENGDVAFKTLSDTVMTMWTNFAKSGNPNFPKSLVKEVPTWQPFESSSKQMMEFGQNLRMVSVPNKERLEKVQTVFLASFRRRYFLNRNHSFGIADPEKESPRSKEEL